ncbi:MAG: cell division protein ZapE [Candidatus Azotimanducaceae bacterium]|jgi:cell division protein ZapE
MNSPLAKYQGLVKAGEIQFDPAQHDAIQRLQKLFDELMQSPTKPSVFSWFTSKPRSRISSGLYFWGGVGRGKTFLMDVFYDALPFENKRRMHFHRFMRHIHQRLKAMQGVANPLKEIAIEFAGQTRVLCFDEFFVSDITDAMILAGLLEAMFENGVVLVATSNVEPRDLYKNGLQRVKFLPAIALLEKFTEVVNVDGGIDYRLRALEDAELYHFPLDDEANISLNRSFTALSPDIGNDQVVLEIEGRNITAKKCGDGVVWFQFAELCEGPRSQNDYIELAMIFQTVLISDIPRFSVDNEDSARRFISLVDEFYDHKVKLIVSAEVGLLDLYQGSRLAFEFQRTASRLQEMQSHEYLGQVHLV